MTPQSINNRQSQSQASIDQYGSVRNIQFPGPRHFTSGAGLDPYEERLALALGGGLAAALASLALLIVCWRRYKLSGLASARRAKWRRQQQRQQLRLPGYLQRAGFYNAHLLGLRGVFPPAGAWNQWEAQPLCVVSSAAVTSSTAATGTGMGIGPACGSPTGLNQSINEHSINRSEQLVPQPWFARRQQQLVRQAAVQSVSSSSAFV